VGLHDSLPTQFVHVATVEASHVPSVAVQLEVTLYTDPACPFAFSSEPVRRRIRWHYGDQLAWRTRMIVLTLEPGESERLAEGAPNLQRRYGMPIDPAPYARAFSSEPACRAVVAVRLHAPELEDVFLRRLRVRAMLGGLLDDRALLGAAARDVSIDEDRLDAWLASAEVEAALQADIAAARDPAPAARALDHKLGGPHGERRYTAPSYELVCDGETHVVPGFNPVEVYETAIANLAPQLERRPKPADVTELLAWAGEPLATAEVALVMELDLQAAHAALARVAQPVAAGADFYWRLPGDIPAGVVRSAP
jgi:predicted DsbA family dithiol-disulfide isomerase